VWRRAGSSCNNQSQRAEGLTARKLRRFSTASEFLRTLAFMITAYLFGLVSLLMFSQLITAIGWTAFIGVFTALALRRWRKHHQSNKFNNHYYFAEKPIQR
jgi:hypothetical protein